MKLITEEALDCEYLIEGKDDQKNHFVSGKFICVNEKNKNGRLYRLENVEPEIGRYIKEMIKTGRSLGELGHPASPQINLDRVSHMVTELNKGDDGFYGKAKILNTPMGNIAKGLLESGAKIGFSTRGMGSLKENQGVMEVQKDFKLSSVDLVADPSGNNCFVNGILEGVEYFYDDARGTWKEEKIHEMKQMAHKMSKRQLEEQALTLMEEYFEMLAVKI